MGFPTFESHAIPISPDGTARDSHPIDAPAADADSDEPAGHRVTTLEEHAGKVDASSRRRGDDHALLRFVRNAIVPGADAHFPLNLGAGSGRAETRSGVSAGGKKRGAGE